MSVSTAMAWPPAAPISAAAKSISARVRGDDHVRAEACEVDGHDPAEPVAGPGHDRRLARKV
jgi:hypothetical protein